MCCVIYDQILGRVDTKPYQIAVQFYCAMLSVCRKYLVSTHLNNDWVEQGVSQTPGWRAGVILESYDVNHINMVIISTFTASQVWACLTI